MSDVRLRILTLVILSLAVYFLPGAVLPALLWWLLLSRLTGKQRVKAAAAAGLISALPTIVLLFSSGSTAFFYGGKTFTLLLLAFWFGQSCAAGEIQSFCVWLFGNHIGFDIGMACEIFLMQTAEIQQDAKTYLQALSEKQKRFGIRTILPFTLGILIPALRRTERFSKLLARRGYSRGGTYTPRFTAEKIDGIRLAAAFLVMLSGVLF